MDTIKNEIARHLDALITSVSDLQAASESEINKWRQRCLKQRHKAKANAISDTIKQITQIYDKNAS